MEKTVILHLVVAIILAEAYRPRIRVFEIRKIKDKHNVDKYVQEVADNYYDPDTFMNRVEKETKNKYKNFPESIITQLQQMNKKANDMKVSSEDETRKISLVIVPDNVNSISKINKPSNQNFRSILQSVLRSQTTGYNVEDRTAPPRHRNYFQYDYDSD